MYRNSGEEFWEREVVGNQWPRVGVEVTLYADKCVLCMSLDVLMKNDHGMVRDKEIAVWYVDSGLSLVICEVPPGLCSSC
jgi:hypothetical protein